MKHNITITGIPDISLITVTIIFLDILNFIAADVQIYMNLKFLTNKRLKYLKADEYWF